MKLIHGDCLEVLKEFDDNSIDSIVTDPPYGISFMGKGWDKVLPPTEIWQECLRVLKPGGYLVAMSASRTYHRLAVQLEDLGMICHPMIGWIYGSGFPKATDLSKQFDKGVEREVIGRDKSAYRANAIQNNINHTHNAGFKPEGSGLITAPSTDLAKKWVGYKYGLQSLKPALEPIAVFQKPWKCKGVKKMTENIEKHGVGAFNIDACRVGTDKIPQHQRDLSEGHGNKLGANVKQPVLGITNYTTGRHPANLLHDGSEVVEQVFMDQSGDLRSRHGYTQQLNTGGGTGNCYVMEKKGNKVVDPSQNGHLGSCSRYFNNLPITDLDAPFNYIAKPSKRERNQGLEGMETKHFQTMGKGIGCVPAEDTAPQQNNHPTVKPIALMNWLVKLVTPEGGTILDPFMGSGTTGIAAREFNFIGIEMNKDYLEIAKKRINGQ